MAKPSELRSKMTQNDTTIQTHMGKMMKIVAVICWMLLLNNDESFWWSELYRSDHWREHKRTRENSLLYYFVGLSVRGSFARQRAWRFEALGHPARYAAHDLPSLSCNKLIQTGSHRLAGCTVLEYTWMIDEFQKFKDSCSSTWLWNALNISEWFSTKAFGAAEKTALASCTFKLCSAQMCPGHAKNC